ncbi:MAG: hypothetical protein ABR600_03990 [Actinomycetota bacterium]
MGYDNGVDATLSVRSADLCDSNDNDRTSSVWIMIEEDNGFGYAQIGYIWDSNLCCLRHFWQWTPNGGVAGQTYTAYFGSPSPGESDSYKVYRDTSDHNIHMHINGSSAPCSQEQVCAETDFDPHSRWPDGAHVAIYGEVNYPGSDISGGDQSRVHVSSILVKEGNDDYSAPSKWNPDVFCPAFFHMESVTDFVHFTIWTDPLGHGSRCQ